VAYNKTLAVGAFPPISELIPDAVPVILQPGDIMIVDRSSLHGSFPNSSSSRRLTMIMSYHKRASAVGFETHVRAQLANPLLYTVRCDAPYICVNTDVELTSAIVGRTCTHSRVGDIPAGESS
jgi:hypothetical protein